MTAVDLTPGSDAWLRLVTASKVAAIAGVSQYDSPRSMFHKMRGDLEREESNGVQRRGHYLEPALLAWWRDQYDLTDDETVWQEQPMFFLGDWGAATPDAYAILDGREVLVEAKTAKYGDEWGEPGTDQIPLSYLFQVMWQMHVSGIHECRVAALITFIDGFAEYVITYDPEVGTMLERTCRTFMDAVEANQPPPVDGHEATHDALVQVYRQVDESSVILDEATAAEYVAACNDFKVAEDRIRAAKSAVREVMADARHATYAGVKVARRQNNRNGTSLIQVAKTLPEPTPETEVTHV